MQFSVAFIFLAVLSYRGKVPQKDMEQIFPGMSGDFTSENFSASWYLIENHAGTGYVYCCLFKQPSQVAKRQSPFSGHPLEV